MKNLKLIVLSLLMIFSGLTFAQDKVKVSGFVQGLYQMDVDDSITDNTFRMRRVRMSVGGNLNKVISYKIQGDFGSQPILVDAYVKAKFCNAFSVQVGQFKVPFSIESPINPVDLEAVDYGEAINKLVGYKDVSGIGKIGRDIGIMFTGGFGAVTPEGGKPYNLVTYNIGIFNGAGPNQTDGNNRKDIVGRIDIRPMAPLTLSASYYNGDFGYKRVRYGFGAKYDDGNFVARTEYINGSTGCALDPVTNLDYFNSNGMYAVAGYWVNFKCGDNEQKILPFVRYDHFAEDINVDTDPYDHFTIGVNYLPYKFLSVKFNYILIEKKVNNAGTIENKASNCMKFMVSYKF